MVLSLYCCRWNYRKKLEAYDQLQREQARKYGPGLLPREEVTKNLKMESDLRAIEEILELKPQEIKFHRGECLHFVPIHG